VRGRGAIGLPRDAGRGRRRLWLLAGLAVALFAVFLWMARAAGHDSSLVAWDARVTDALVGARTVGWDRVFWCFSLLGSTPVMVALTSTAILLLLVWGRRARAVLAAGALLTAQGASDLAKALVHRARPSQAIALIARPGSFSLPSGHAFLTLVFLGLLVFLAFRALRSGGSNGAASVGRRSLPFVFAILAATVVVLVGLSRVYLGVHWASDVLAGWCLGGAWLALSLGLFQTWDHGSRSLRDSRPWRGRASRVSVTVVLALVAAAVVFLAAGADPLLARPLP
jgi:membrane-associated phospholipid phosphatase